MERLRFSFARKKSLAYVSHLDMLRLFLRALRRSSLPLAYSQGYNPHPRITLALPLPLGVTASEELGEIYFAETIGPEKFLDLLGRQLPESLELLGAVSAKPELPSLASKVSAAHYRVFISGGSDPAIKEDELREALEGLLAKEEILMERQGKKKKTTCLNVRPYIFEAALLSEENRPLELSLILKAGSSGGVSPFFILGRLETENDPVSFNVQDWHVHREKLYAEQNGILQPLSEGM